MITCHLSSVVDPAKIAEFERYARAWIGLVNRFGGQHHGYLLPSEGASDVAYATFSFPSLAEYERYRTQSMQDAECQQAFRFAETTGCIRRYDRTFLRPVLEAAALND